MFILDQFPDPDRLRPTAANEGYRRQFYARWGKENCIVCATSRRIEFPPFVQRLSVKSVVGGAEHYRIDGRTTTLDDDNYLVLNDRRCYGSTIAAERPVHTFSIFFAPGFAEEVTGSALGRSDSALDGGRAFETRGVDFAEHLRPHDRLVTPVLRYIREQVLRGMRDEVWLEEQLVFLVERLLEGQRHTISVAAQLPLARLSTRREVARRISLATDYIHSNFRRAIRIDELARAAHLSKYHFIRLFTLVHGQTPYSFLQGKRANAARRLLETTELSHTEIATRVGFDNRTTMFRQLRRWTGSSGFALRRRSRGEVHEPRDLPRPAPSAGPGHRGPAP